MYEAFFEFESRPFLAAPRADRYVPNAVMETARQTLSRCIDRGEGAGLITGAPGTGKTLLCQLVIAEFEKQFSVAHLASGRLGTRRALLHSILYELALPFRGLDEGEARLSLLDALEPVPGNRGLLLVIDEAHTLPCSLMDEVRMLTNLVRNGEGRVRVVLAGSALLEERFASPKMSSFAQRLAARCFLESLDGPETAEYVKAQLAAVGGDPAKLIDAEALAAIHHATDGVPRLINQVCDHALILARLGGTRRLTSAAIEEAWADLQQLPTPVTVAREEAAGAQVVEFGGLDDRADELPDAIPFRGVTAGSSQLQQPDEQLDAIESHLAKIDDRFRPSLSIGDEVELEFAHAGAGFDEQFAEEEVVLDRYSSVSEMFALAPRVSSWEGRQIGSLLDLQAAPSSKQQATQWPKIRTEERATGNVTTAAARRALTALSPEPRNAKSGQPNLSNARQLEAAQLDQLSCDRDMIVVEDDAPPAAARPDGEVRKVEYRQLFARLRRG